MNNVLIMAKCILSVIVIVELKCYAVPLQRQRNAPQLYMYECWLAPGKVTSLLVICTLYRLGVDLCDILLLYSAATYVIVWLRTVSPHAENPSL